MKFRTRYDEKNDCWYAEYKKYIYWYSCYIECGVFDCWAVEYKTEQEATDAVKNYCDKLRKEKEEKERRKEIKKTSKVKTYTCKDFK